MKTTFQIDSAHSAIHFSIRHMMIANVRGAFTGIKGTVIYDSENPADSSVHAEVDVNTIQTHDAKLSIRLLSNE